MQPDKPQTKVVPTEVPKIAPPVVSIKVFIPRVHMTLAPLRVITHRVSMISQEDNIEYIRQMIEVENNKRHHRRHLYLTIITQVSQEINQVNSTATTANKHKQCIMNVNLTSEGHTAIDRQLSP